MATIQSSIQLTDGMSPVLRAANASLEVLIKTWDTAKAKISQGLGVNSSVGSLDFGVVVSRLDDIVSELRDANAELGYLNGKVESLEGNTNDVIRSMERMDDNISAGTTELLEMNLEMVESNRHLIELNNTAANIDDKINENTRAQDNFNNSVKNGEGFLENMYRKVRNIAFALGGVQAVGKVIGTVDDLTQTKARLNLMNNKGDQTPDELLDKVYQASLRSRGDYLSMASAVAKMGQRTENLFSNPDEIITFTENLNKLYTIAGATQQEAASATLQLSQAIGSGVLRGEEFRAVFESTPNVMQTIADHLGVDVGQMKVLAEEGKLTSNIIRDAFIGATDKINDSFSKMPFTFEQAWMITKNNILNSSRPILQMLSDITSSERFIKFADGAAKSIESILSFFQRLADVASPILAGIFDTIEKIYTFVSENWSLIEPVVWGVVVAMLAYKSVLMAVATWTSITTLAASTAKGIKVALATATWALTGATKAEAAAQWGLNAAMLANPVGLVIVAVIALIAIFYAAVAAVNKFTGTSYSATGMICGAFMWLGAQIANQWIRIWNVGYGVIKWLKQAWVWLSDNIGTVFNNIGVWWDNLCIDMYSMFGNLIIKLLDKLASFLGKFQDIADLINVDLGFDKIINAAKAGVSSGVDALKSNKKQLKSLTEFNPNVNWNHTDVFDANEAFDKGYNWGAEKAAKLEELVKGLDPEKQIEELRKLEEKVKSESDKYGSDLGDVGKTLSGSLDNPAIDSISKNVDNISKDLEDVNKSLNVSDDEMNYIRKLAEREAIDKATRNDVTVNITNNNQIKDDLDVQRVAKELARKVHEEIMASPEGIRL